TGHLDFIRRVAGIEETYDISESPKLVFLVSAIINCKERKRKLIVCSSFVSLLSMYLDILVVRKILKDEEIFKIWGEMNDTDRYRQLDDFNNCEGFSILFLSVKAGGQGLNIQTCSEMLILEPVWEYATLTQLVSRIYRIGQKEHVRLYHLVLKNTLEEIVIERCLRKRIITNA